MTAAEVAREFVVGESEASWQAFGITLYKYDPFTMRRGKLQASFSRMFPVELIHLSVSHQRCCTEKQQICCLKIKEIQGILSFFSFPLRLLWKDKMQLWLTQSAHMFCFMRKIINWNEGVYCQLHSSFYRFSPNWKEAFNLKEQKKLNKPLFQLKTTDQQNNQIQKK